MKIDLTGEALRLLEDFLYYGASDPHAIADAMWYCEDAFSKKIRMLQTAYEQAEKGEESHA